MEEGCLWTTLTLVMGIAIVLAPVGGSEHVRKVSGSHGLLSPAENQILIQVLNPSVGYSFAANHLKSNYKKCYIDFGFL
jgi:hypothetical protein